MKKYTVYTLCPEFNTFAHEVEQNTGKELTRANVVDILMDFGTVPADMSNEDFQKACRIAAWAYFGL